VSADVWSDLGTVGSHVHRARELDGSAEHGDPTTRGSAQANPLADPLILQEHDHEAHPKHATSRMSVTEPEPSGTRAPVHTGLPDHVYDVVLLLQQAASDVVRYERFAEDADHAGDRELANWLRELADSDREIVSRARAMLLDRLAQPGG